MPHTLWQSSSRQHRRRPATLLIALATAVAALVVTVPDFTAHAAEGPQVTSAVTTPDRSKLLAEGASPTFTDEGTPPSQLIEIDPGEKYQTMDGFGASLTDSSASLLSDLPEAQRDEAMTSLFSPTEGIGTSLLRQPIGASDFVDGEHYTYNDLPEGETDLEQEKFSIAHDEEQILPLLRQALELNPELKIMATPWSVPAWMKEGGSLNGGRVKDDPEYFRSYARYLTKFVQAYAEAGVPVFAVSIQNEPQNRRPDYPGTDLPVAHQNAVIAELGPMLEEAGLGEVQIISYDHNWSEHPEDLADAEEMGVDPETEYPFDALEGSAAEWIDGTGFHSYSGESGRQNQLHEAHPDKGIWFTEGSGWHGKDDSFDKYFSDTLKWEAQNIQIGAVRNWAKGTVLWNLALDSQGGPVNGGCGSNPEGMCTGVLAIDGDQVTRNAEYYTIGHMSRFVQQGAVRIGSENTGDLHNVAFENPDGSITVVVNNIGGGEQTFGIGWDGMHISDTLPGGAVSSYTWDAGGGAAEDS